MTGHKVGLNSVFLNLSESYFAFAQLEISNHHTNSLLNNVFRY